MQSLSLPAGVISHPPRVRGLPMLVVTQAICQNAFAPFLNIGSAAATPSASRQAACIWGSVLVR